MVLLFFPLRPAAASYGENLNSVHFNSMEPDFGIPPRRSILISGDLRPSGDGEYWGSFTSPYYLHAELTPEAIEKRREWQRQRQKVLRAEASNALAVGQWDRARRLLLQAGETTGWTGGLRDRVEVLTAAVRQPLSPARRAHLRTYLRGMDALESVPDRRNVAQIAFESVYNDLTADFLREHALYQLASLYHEWWDFPKAIERYEALLKEFPKTIKREAALIMIARCAILPHTPAGRRPEAGRSAIARLRQEFPNGRFRRAAEGLAARLDLLSGRHDAALEGYLRLNDLPSVETVLEAMPEAKREIYRPRVLAAYLRDLDRASNYNQYVYAIRGISRTMETLSAVSAAAFVGPLKAQPDLAAPYFYYRLYHCDNTPKDLIQLARLADRIVARNGDRLPPIVQVRLAEVYYRRGAYRDALRWAERAKRSGGTEPRSYDRALYVHAASLHRLKRGSAALIEFQTLLARCPNSALRRGAREEMAILSEERGDLATALDQYFFLDYQGDIAYLLDVRMTVAQVEDYIAAHPRHPKHDLLLYSLGIRYLRRENLSAARRCFRSLSPVHYKNLRLALQKEEPAWYDEPTDPLKVIDQMMELRRLIRRAPTREQRAAALYREASFFYKGSYLAFYNAPLWLGKRAFHFVYYWNPKVSRPADYRSVRSHMYAHEVYARALGRCKIIARDYPDTSSAAPALYRAACSADRLAGFNEWWRAEDRDHAGLSRQSVLLMRELVRRYPKHPLAKDARKYAKVFNGEEVAAH
jgi:outer membrane protein assembly factor BamD (BamD/ComL family)